MSPVICDIKKGHYVCYRCTNHRLKEALDKIGITQKHLKSLKTALKESFSDENTYNKIQTKQISEEIEMMEARLKQMYLDKLDGNIDNDLWLEYRNKWSMEIASLYR